MTKTKQTYFNFIDQSLISFREVHREVAVMAKNVIPYCCRLNPGKSRRLVFLVEVLPHLELRNIM